MSFMDKLNPRKDRPSPLMSNASAGQPSPGGHRLPPITASQFLSHVEQICEDESRKALKGQVDEVDPVEVIAFARRLSELRARHVALGLAVAMEKSSMTSRSHEELGRLRDRIRELEAAFSALKTAIKAGRLTVRGVS